MPRILLALLIAFSAFAIAVPAPLGAQERPELTPDGWRSGQSLRRPELGDLKTLRFVTDSDFPPFNYFDEDGALTGFNVDVARDICEVLAVECDIRAVEWSEIFGVLERGDADAAIASIRITEDALKQADFTRRYYETPARFVARKDSPLRDMRPESLRGRKIGVADGTGHEAFLNAFFEGSEIAVYPDAAAAREALMAREVDVLFGDGISLMFWLNGTDAQGCCEYRGGPFLESYFFGQGVGIAVAKDKPRLRQALNWALNELHVSGRSEELFLRYFPMSFF